MAVSDFADALLDDPDALPTLRCYVPYDEPRPPADDPAGIEVYDAALEVMLLAAGDRSTTPVAYVSQLKFPVRAGEMIAWSVCETGGRTVDMTMVMVVAEEGAEEPGAAIEGDEEPEKPEPDTVRR